MSSTFSPLRGRRRIYYQLIVAWKQTCQEARIIFTLNFCKLLFRPTKGLLAKQIITFAFWKLGFRIIINHYVEYVVCLKYFKVRTKLSLLKIKVNHYSINKCTMHCVLNSLNGSNPRNRLFSQAKLFESRYEKY